MSCKFEYQTIDGLELIACHPEQPARGAPPLIFVHGAFAAAWTWAECFMPRAAAAGYSSYAVSLRGHGQSFGREHIDHHSIRDYVDDLSRIVEAVGQPPVLIGHSMGGFVVQKYLEHHSARAAVLMSSVPPQGLVAATFHLFMKRPGLLMEINGMLADQEISLASAREALFAKPVSDELLTRFLQRMSKESTRAIWDMSMFNLVNISAVRRTPLLVLGAEIDQLIPAFLVSATGHSYAVPAHIFNGFGHAFPLEPGGEVIIDAAVNWLENLLD
ncbi:MAG TPA: alpha/beta hydrolase [Rhodocyclaceae bacterium]|nr:alpha/beta hydrolase [Rhodocyclaceae bacterium]